MRTGGGWSIQGEPLRTLSHGKNMDASDYLVLIGFLRSMANINGQLGFEMPGIWDPSKTKQRCKICDYPVDPAEPDYCIDCNAREDAREKAQAAERSDTSKMLRELALEDGDSIE